MISIDELNINRSSLSPRIMGLLESKGRSAVFRCSKYL